MQIRSANLCFYSFSTSSSNSTGWRRKLLLLQSSSILLPASWKRVGVPSGMGGWRGRQVEAHLLAATPYTHFSWLCGGWASHGPGRYKHLVSVVGWRRWHIDRKRHDTPHALHATFPATHPTSASSSSCILESEQEEHRRTPAPKYFFPHCFLCHGWMRRMLEVERLHSQHSPHPVT